MNRVLAVFVALALLTSVPVFAGESEAVSKAQQAASSWLALTDAGELAASWDEASSFFKASIAKGDWEKRIGSVRSPFGALKSRKVKSATFRRKLPGAPDGEYVVIQYDSAFERKASAVETVTPMREKDGSWKVSGYYIR